MSASREGTARSKIGLRIKSGSITHIDFKHPWILFTTAESCENIAKSATVLIDLTSSRFICFVNLRFWKEYVELSPLELELTHHGSFTVGFSLFKPTYNSMSLCIKLETKSRRLLNSDAMDLMKALSWL